ncbi:hypothetical protein ACQ1PF_07920 [Ornithobacterium rhinotracheale]
MEKETKHRIVIAIILFSIIAYLSFAFVLWDLNTSNWSMFVRLLFVSILLIGNILIVGEIHERFVKSNNGFPEFTPPPPPKN